VESYARRMPVGKDERYSFLRPDVLYLFQEKQRALVRLLATHARSPLDSLRVLEVGCGAGGNLSELIWLGFNPVNLTGNELLPERAALARRNLPSACRVLEGDATGLDLPDSSFDIVYQSVVFTSVLEPDVQDRLAACMWRWVRPGGGVLWYDFLFDNPWNSDVRGVPLSRIRALFPRGNIDVKRVTLAPPIGRFASKLNTFAYRLMNALPWLRTHVFCWIGKD
jgi:SAM-dependent methyltransferase